MLEGIDFSYGNGLTTQQIKDAGKAFVCRYLSGGGSKDIGPAELANYKTAGIPVVFVWETTGQMPSEAQGITDARAALAELVALAAAVKDMSVATAPVFFAADAQAEGDLLGYMRGVDSVFSIGPAAKVRRKLSKSATARTLRLPRLLALTAPSRVGIYGGFGSVQAVLSAGLASYGWQTYAWSVGQWDTRARLRQVQNGVDLGPAQVDLDQAAFWASNRVLGVGDDYGQWPRPASTPPPVEKGPYRHVIPRGNTVTLAQLATSRHETPAALLAFNQGCGELDTLNRAVLEAFAALDAACTAAGDPAPALPAGLVYYTIHP